MKKLPDWARKTAPFVGAALFFIVAFAAGRCSAPDPVGPVEIDTAKVDVKIDEQVAVAERTAEQRLEEIENKFQDDIEDFSEAQEAEYREVREQGPEAVTAWLQEFNRSLRRTP